MPSEKKDISNAPLRDSARDSLLEEKDIEIISLPGLSVNLRHGDTLELVANGNLKTVCSPILKNINSRLQEEKPALVQEAESLPRPGFLQFQARFSDALFLQKCR